MSTVKFKDAISKKEGNSVGKVEALLKVAEACKKYVPRGKRLRAFFDCVWWWKKYHLPRAEYFEYNYIEVSHKERMKYIRDTEVLYDLQIKNDPEESKILDDKSVFNRTFRNYLGRNFCVISSPDYDLFCDFVKSYPVFMKKPIDQLGGSGIERIDLSQCEESERMSVFDRLLSNGSVLLEECFIQHETMAALNPDTANTIRVITMRDADGVLHTPLANVRIGRKGMCVDNFCSGGMTAGIDIATGKVFSSAVNKDREWYSVHPDTGIEICGFQIPFWNEILRTVKEAAEGLPHCRYIGWDAVIAKDGRICLIEGNSNPEARIHQLVCGHGLRDVYKKYLGEF